MLVGSVADAESGGFGELGREVESWDVRHTDGSGYTPSGLADPELIGLQGGGNTGCSEEVGPARNKPRGGRAIVGMADAAQQRRDEGRGESAVSIDARSGPTDPVGRSEHGRPGPVNGFWRNADWIFCRDGKWRAVEPGTSPLATGVAGRVGRLRAYGNGLNAEAARIFIEHWDKAVKELA
jgi:DNA (cytosine-5)-methyltransferase 1